MVFIGGWRSRRRGRPYGGPFGGGRYDGYGPPPGYGRRYGGGGGSCARDLCLVESGCCLADALGCGPQLGLVAPSLIRRSVRSAAAVRSAGATQIGKDGTGASRTQAFLLSAIRIYQTEISPRRRPVCRYTPSCSHYAAQALERHGLRRGGWLAARRLVRCRPGATGGPDPVPERSAPGNNGGQITV